MLIIFFFFVFKEPNPIPEENLEKIRQMWATEDALTEEQRSVRYNRTPISLNEVIPWSEYATTQPLAKAGVGRDRPNVNSEINGKVACWRGSCM